MELTLVMFIQGFAIAGLLVVLVLAISFIICDGAIPKEVIGVMRRLLNLLKLILLGIITGIFFGIVLLTVALTVIIGLNWFVKMGGSIVWW